MSFKDLMIHSEDGSGSNDVCVCVRFLSWGVPCPFPVPGTLSMKWWWLTQTGHGSPTGGWSTGACSVAVGGGLQGNVSLCLVSLGAVSELHTCSGPMVGSGWCAVTVQTS